MISQAKKELLIKFVDSICEICHKKKKLEVHRIRRGYKGGEYNLRNVIVMCAKCHKNIHYMEF